MKKELNYQMTDVDEVKDKLHRLLITEGEGGFINYYRDRNTDEELIIAYKLGLIEGKL